MAKINGVCSSIFSYSSHFLDKG